MMNEQLFEKRKEEYLQRVYKELNHRGITDAEIPCVLNKTGFISALNDYPEEQLHYSVKSAVNEILVTAATN